MNTLENNKLITEFMELPFITEDGETNYIKDLIHVPDYELSYHEDWNWLMEVVEKIENWENGQYYIIHSMYFNKRNISIKAECNRDFKNIDIFYNEGEKIQAVYKACVEFIKWYNAQNS